MPLVDTVGCELRTRPLSIEKTRQLAHYRKCFVAPVCIDWTDTMHRALHAAVLENEPWHLLYFFPLPHGQGSFRPTFLPVEELDGRTVGGCAARIRAALRGRPRRGKANAAVFHPVPLASLPA